MGNGTLRAKKTLVNEKPRILKYFSSSVQKEIARNVGDIETQRDLIIGFLEGNHPDLVRIFTDNYYGEVDDFVEYIEQKYPRISKIQQDKKMGISQDKIVSQQKRGKKAEFISVKRGSKSYKRQKSTKIENKKLAVAFVKTRVNQGKSNKEITAEYNSFAKSKGWVTRSQSSIYNLRHRNKIKKNG